MENEQSTLPGEFRVFAITRNCLSDPPLKRDMGEPVEFDDLAKAIHHMEQLRKKSPSSVFVRQHRHVIEVNRLIREGKIEPPEPDNIWGQYVLAAEKNVSTDAANRRILEFHIEEKIDGYWQAIDPNKLDTAREIMHEREEEREKRVAERIRLTKKYGSELAERIIDPFGRFY